MNQLQAVMSQFGGDGELATWASQIQAGMGQPLAMMSQHLGQRQPDESAMCNKESMMGALVGY